MSRDTDDDNDAMARIRASLKGSAETLRKADLDEEIRNEPRGKTLADRVAKVTLPVRRIGKLYEAAEKLGRVIGPVARPLAKAAWWSAGKMKSAFEWAAFEREKGDFKRDKDGDRIFSAKRLAKVFGGVAVGVVAGTIAVKAGIFYGTHFDQTIYVTGKQEIEAGELYQFTGCTSLPCSTTTDNGEYYQIERSWIFPNLLYPENDVYAHIPQDRAVCEIQGYGIYFRGLKWLHKSMEWYQNVYSASCRPLTDEEVQAMAGQPELPSAFLPPPQAAPAP